jgi:hypothetical protein
MLHTWADIGTLYTLLVEGLKAKRFVLKKYELTSHNLNIVYFKLTHFFSLLLGPVMILL